MAFVILAARRHAAKKGPWGLFGADTTIYGLYASLIAAGISTFGIASMSMFSDWARRNSAFCSAFAVGILSVGVLFHLIPEAMDISPMAIGWVGAGFVFMVLSGMGVQAAVNQRVEGAALTFGYASIIGLSVHSFLDGGIYAASFHEELFTGWLATAGLLLHEFPEGAIAYALLIQAGLGKFRAMLMAVVAAALTTVAGTLVGNLIISASGELPISAMLGVAAGALIYVLIVHLIPHAAKSPNGRGYALASLGVITGTLAIILQSLAGGH